MAAAAQKKVLEVIKSKVMSVDDRYDGYRDELMAVLYDICRLETDQPRNIAQQVSRRVSALGELLVQKEGNLE